MWYTVNMRNQFGQYRKGNINQHVGKTHCEKGHEFTELNTRVYTRPDGVIERVCKSCMRNAYQRHFYNRPDRIEKERLRQRDKERHVHDRVIELLGNECACCGEADKRFLTVDHINNDGARHREQGHHRVYREILRDPDALKKYQCLCMNCNWAKHAQGYCPHQLQRLEWVDACQSS